MFEMNNNYSFSNYENTGVYNDKVCPRCNLSLMELMRSGVVGCANCYKVFENEIRSRILQKQGTINHIGKKPSRFVSKIKIKEKIAELEKEKEIAANEENYIVAEALKNQIEKLKGELWWRIIVQLLFQAEFACSEI